MMKKIFASFILLLSMAMIAQSSVHGLPKIQQVISPQHKIGAWLIENHQIPLITMNFAFFGGAAYDPNEKAGLSQFVAALLDEGAGPYNSEEFQTKIEELAMKFGANTDGDRFNVFFQCITKNKTPSLELLRLALTQPRFDKEPFERIKTQTLVSIERKKENPSILATEKAFRMLFPTHPYGRPQSGTAETVNSFTQEDCKNFVQQRLTTDKILVAVAGDITAEELGKVLDQCLGNLPQKSSLQSLPEVEPQFDGGLNVINLQDRSQTVSVFFQPGVKRSDPAFYAAYILNHILGGGSFTARLMTEVRSKRGLTYSIGTQLLWLEKANFLIGSCSTENNRFYESHDVIQSVFKELRQTGPSKEEIEEAKDYITGSFPLMMDNSKNLVHFLIRMQKDNLGIDFLEKRNDFIKAVSEEQIKDITLKFLAPEKLTFFAAGNPIKANN